MIDFSESGRFDLSNQGLGDKIVKEKLAKAIKEDPTVTGLHLSNNNIGPEGARAIAEVLKDNVAIQILMLGVNNIGDEGAKAIAEALKYNAHMVGLFLIACNISYEGAKAVAGAAQNTSIHELNLRYNNLNTEEEKLISQVLQDNNIIQESYTLNVEEEVFLAKVLQIYSHLS